MRCSLPVVFYSLFFLLLLQASCLAQESNTSQAAGLSVEEPKNYPYLWDFGSITEGEIVEHIFTIKNDSLKTIKITSINTSCGCTASKAQKEELLPGEKTDIEVKFNSRGYSGEVEQFVYVNTDNPDETVIKLTIKARVVK